MTDKKQPLSDYRANAEECLRMAETAQIPEHKQSWLRLAHSWLRMLPQRGPAAPTVPAASREGDETDKAP